VSITKGTVDQVSNFLLANASPIGGGASMGDGTVVSESWSTGTGTNQWNKAGTYEYTLAASATQLIDLQADLGLDGAALSLVEVRHFRAQGDSTNVGNVTMEVDATNGWDAWLDGVGDIVNITPSSTHGFTCGVDGSYAVDATHKELLLTNLDGVNAAIIRIEVVGVNA